MMPTHQGENTPDFFSEIPQLFFDVKFALAKSKL